MNEKKKLGGWERLVIFFGIVFTIPTIIFGFVIAHESLEEVALTLLVLVIIWAIVGGLLWIIKRLGVP